MILGTVVAILTAVVGKLWFNHQKHFQSAVNDIKSDMADVKRAAEKAHDDCKSHFDATALPIRKDIRELYGLTRSHGEKIAALEAK